MPDGTEFDLTLPRFRSHVTLVLCLLLHAFTHAYGSLLVPLYLPMKDDLHLSGVGSASLIVTIYVFVYCLASYPAGMLADRWNRKALLGVGLVLNAIAILCMGLTRHYELFVALGILGGLAGTLFHPAANALSTAHYPKSPGMAIGILSVGSAIGFFAGPRFAGWRAGNAGWQTPLVEAGWAGIAFGVLFLLIAKEVRKPRDAAFLPLPPGEGRGEGGNGDGRVSQEEAALTLSLSRRERGPEAHPPMGVTLRNRMIAVALVLAGRDFTGIATISLSSLYLQKARGMSVSQAGLIIGSMMLVAVVVNPLAVYFSAGRRRLPVLFSMLIAGGCVVASVPWFDVKYVLAVLCAFQALHLGSYAVSEAAMLERVSPAVRGRVIGLFITIAGTIAALAPWLMGRWTDAMGEAAHNPRSFALPFAVLCCLHTAASLSVFLIRRLSEKPISEPVEPISEIMPATVEVAG